MFATITGMHPDGLEGRWAALLEGMPMIRVALVATCIIAALWVYYKYPHLFEAGTTRD